MKSARCIQLVALACLLAVFIAPSHSAEPLRRLATPSQQPPAASRMRPNPRLQAFRLELAAYRQDLAVVERRVQQMKVRQRRLRELAAELSSTRDDAQLAQVDLQNVLQRQQQTLQMMSNIFKKLNDTEMSVIRKMGG
jgi:chromosome segregation ATPase